ncbi:choline-binding transcriptional repressor BetI [Mameliella sediminis]|uniref:choline-binding transcriptional repressor BetI n=1 Tax=Mameliella sediminis TaxID=2836866 RepID=UPI001C4830A6|nr:transcriptional regulator BetI [Mameliella sediminis]MBY6116238.1 transcriptional regulator BetI [Antarctobacter heliothermus]MBY6146203.1 transcriptional regulator BetI [Mameliella alba]MBV7396992.1 transcriptional regulator BetI [Mameliella sediminis]MBY6161860.1 transcriptional regulator BetI [Mameliella alba]MBY6170330.1 transcriptional regulator BetI [Mameliella alba]
MPKIGQEPIRRAALMEATVAEIGEVGSLDVTVSRIAKRAGMSSALAHHYYGGKSQIFLAAMRHILSEYGAEVRAALAEAPNDRRLEAVIAANFADSCFQPETVSAWLNFYVLARREPEAARLLHIYQRRLQSNLVHALRGRAEDPQAVATTIAALIDGVYLRAALSGGGVAGAAAQVTQAAHALMRTP